MPGSCKRGFPVVSWGLRALNGYAALASRAGYDLEQRAESFQGLQISGERGF